MEAAPPAAATAAGAGATSVFPDEVLEHVFSFLETDRDRNAASLVCTAWYHIERGCRRRIFVGNCYAVSPGFVVRRFPKVRAVEIKGKPHFADFNLVPSDWGGNVHPWIEAMAEAYPGLEELRLKRMVVTDESLELLSLAFRSFKVLVMVSCEGFSSIGLAAIASNCRNLVELDLQENDIDDRSGHWMSCFPESCTSLVSLNIACLEGEVSFSALERLVKRCPNLRVLKLNHDIPLDKLPNLLLCAPQLVDLGTGAFSSEYRAELFSKLSNAFEGCKNLHSLSGFWSVASSYMPTINSICPRLTSLNLSYAVVPSPDLVKLVSQCHSLQRLWVLDHIEDVGLQAVAENCKNLEELRVFPSNPHAADQHVALTELGLVAVSHGCEKLNSVLYFCRQMTNAALIDVARNRPNLIRFRLCIIVPHTPDYITQKPFDAGFGAIVKSCKNLRRLSLSGLLTDRMFEYIGTNAKNLEMLSIAFAGDSDMGLHYILSGCKNLRKLEIRDCPFGDNALLANAAKLETMRSLWMSSCAVTLGACKLLAEKMPSLNVEVIDERGQPEMLLESDNKCSVEKLYIYRTVAGRRSDMPEYVRIMPCKR